MTASAGITPLSKRRSQIYVLTAVFSLLLGAAMPNALNIWSHNGLDLSNTFQYLILAIQELLLIGFPAILLAYKSQVSRERFEALWHKPGSYAVGLVSVAAVVFSLASVLIASLWYVILDSLGISVPLEISYIKPNNGAEYVMAFICAAVIPAFSEEIMFRGHLLGWLRGRMGDRLACVIGGLIFAVLHFSLQGFASLMAIGMFLSLLAVRYASLWLSIIFHAIYNGVVIMLNGLDAQPSIQMVMLTTGVFIALSYVLFKREGTRSWN